MLDEPSADCGDGEGESAPLPADGESREIDPQAEKPRDDQVALNKAKTFDEFRAARPFKFLHLYSGPKDPLGEAKKMEGARNRLEVTVCSLDKAVDNIDLSVPTVHRETLSDVKNHEWDYVHAGFPCGSFSRARHNPMPGQPGPVRNKLNIYGLMGNASQQQAEADKGTRMAAQSAEIYKAQVGSCKARRVPPLSTLKNPPGDDVSGSAWDLPGGSGVVEDGWCEDTVRHVRLPDTREDMSLQARSLGRANGEHQQGQQDMFVPGLVEARDSDRQGQDGAGGRVS